jgi:hypothetical protein
MFQQGRLPAQYLDDKVLLSDKEAWTYVQLPLTQYEYMTASSREFLCHSLALAFSSLVTASTETVDVHLRLAYRPLDTTSWGLQLNGRVKRYGPTPGWDGYLLDMADQVERCGFHEKEVYLGVKLGNRRKGVDGGSLWDELLAPVRKLTRGVETVAGYQDEWVPESELSHWHRKAADVHRTLAGGAFKAIPATAEQVAWLIAHPFWPAMEQPPVTASKATAWGSGSLRHLVESDITNNRRWLEIGQAGVEGPTDTGFIAYLAVSRFPDALEFPAQEPWMHLVAHLPYEVEFSSRFSIVPPLRVQKDVSRKLADAKDQAQHIAEAGTSAPLKVREQLEVATQLEYLIDKERTPWAYGRHRIIVTGRTADELTDRCRSIIELYRELGMDIAWPTGDQLPLLQESLPGGPNVSRSYYQRQDLATVAGGMPTASADVGDMIEDGRGWIGPYLGRTTSRVSQPVFFSPHVAMATNHAPGCAIIGQPGGGKSFLAFTLAYQMASQGAWTIYIDPKADAKPMGELPGLGNPRVFDLRDGHDGMLDPFSMGKTPADGTLLAMETLRLLLGGQFTAENEALMTPVVTEVAHSPRPSLARVAELLVNNKENAAAHNLGTYLTTLSELPFARLCFSATGGTRLRPEDGLTVVTLLGLELPTSETTPTEYSYDQRLAVAVMYLLARYARQLMLNMDKSHPKAICIDEAWAITSTAEGSRLVPEIARMGRSHNTALVLVSQNAGDLMQQSVTNSVSTRFAFRSQDDAEIADVLKLFGLEDDQGLQFAIKNLRNGECLMQDANKRIARVQIDSWNQTLFHAFDTNPETRGTSPGGDE